jgi:hypothetical protein
MLKLTYPPTGHCMESSQDGRTPKSRSTVTDISLCERP